MSPDWSEIENQLASVANDFSVFGLLSPTNEEKQRELFENDEVENPDFDYPEPDHDPEDKREAILSIEIPDGEYSQQFEARRKRQELRNRVVRSRGDSERIIEASRGIYGEPSEEVVERAREILDSYPDKVRPRPHDAGDVAAALETAMQLYSLEYGEDVFGDWNVEIDDSRDTTYTSRKNQEFRVGTRDYLERDPFRIVVHELGRHALLRENRRAQRETEEGKDALRNFVYESETEEGITTNLERLSDTENPEILRKYALRALVVESVLEGNDFRQTYEMLSEHESDPDMLWNTTLRAHRGGGFIKDHIYLQGREKVREYLESGGSLKPLYAGKVPLDSVEKAEEMMREGELQEPEYSPVIIHNSIEKFW